MAIGVVSILSACGPGATSQVSPTPSPSRATESPTIAIPSPSPAESTSPSPTPTTTNPVLTCTSTPTAASEPLVMLSTKDNPHTLIDSFANPTKPVTLC